MRQYDRSSLSPGASCGEKVGLGIREAPAAASAAVGAPRAFSLRGWACTGPPRSFESWPRARARTRRAPPLGGTGVRGAAHAGSRRLHLAVPHRAGPGRGPLQRRAGVPAAPPGVPPRAKARTSAARAEAWLPHPRRSLRSRVPAGGTLGSGRRRRQTLDTSTGPALGRPFWSAEWFRWRRHAEVGRRPGAAGGDPTHHTPPARPRGTTPGRSGCRAGRGGA
jgi:hypothetical protein